MATELPVVGVSRMAEAPGLTDEEVRNAAICLLASDSAMCDGMTPERAVEFVRGMENALNTEPYWKDGGHMGDCTKQPCTCARCMFEEAEAEARARYVGDPWPIPTTDDPQGSSPEVELLRLRETVTALTEALEQVDEITSPYDESGSGDIEEVRSIVRAALARLRGSPREPE